MQKSKTQNSVGALSGLQGVFDFMQASSSPTFSQYQLPSFCRYRIDHQSTVQPIWGNRHHG